MKWVFGGVIGLLIGWIPVTVVGLEDEVAYFRLKGYSGFLESRNLFFKSTTKSAGLETIQSEPRLQKELGLATQSYIYHPNLLWMNISGSLFVDQRNFSSERISTLSSSEVTNSEDDITWNFSSHFSLLRRKPYPMTFFFTRNNPLISSGLSDSFLLEETSYGFGLTLIKPFTPFTIRLGGSRKTRTGESTDQITDETSDRFRLRMSERFLKTGRMSFDYVLMHRDSLSGSKRRPIEGNEFTDHRVTLNSRLDFGKAKQFNLSEVASLHYRDFPERVDTRFSPIFRWQHTPDLRSTYRYNFSSTNLPGNVDSSTHSGSAGIRYSYSERLSGNASVSASHSGEAGDFRRRRFGTSAGVAYNRPVPYGSLSLGTQVDYSRHDQERGDDRINVRDEALTFVGSTTRIKLARDFIFVDTIVVRNATDQILTEGVDYRVIVIGAQTEIQRLAAPPGTILDGDTVEVDYSYSGGGTFAFSQLGLTFNADLRLARHYHLYLRYRTRDQAVESGFPTNPLNSVTSIELGSRANVPLPWWSLKVGGEANYRRQDEDIASFDSTNFSAYIQIPSLPYQSSMQLSARSGQTNNDVSPEGSDIIGFNARLSSRPWRRLNITAEFDHEIDTGGTIEISRSVSNLNASYSLRRVRISAEASYSQRSQGEFDSEDLRAMLFVRRDIW